MRVYTVQRNARRTYFDASMTQKCTRTPKCGVSIQEPAGNTSGGKPTRRPHQYQGVPRFQPQQAKTYLGLASGHVRLKLPSTTSSPTRIPRTDKLHSHGRKLRKFDPSPPVLLDTCATRTQDITKTRQATTPQNTHRSVMNVTTTINTAILRLDHDLHGTAITKDREETTFQPKTRQKNKAVPSPPRSSLLCDSCNQRLRPPSSQLVGKKSKPLPSLTRGCQTCCKSGQQTVRSLLRPRR